MAGLSLGVNGGVNPRASTKIAQPKAVRSVPAIAPVAGLLDSAPVLWFELEPIGDCSFPWDGVDVVLVLSFEACDAAVVGFMGALEPGEAVDTLEPIGAISRPFAAPLEPEPASPESLALELPVPEPDNPESLPLELPAPELARPLPPALELGVPSLVFAKPPPAALEPVAPEVVGFVPELEVPPGRLEVVLNPPPALELGVSPV
jgi:hypothetical protein